MLDLAYLLAYLIALPGTLIQFITTDSALSVPSLACAPSSSGCGLEKTGTAGRPPYDLYSAVAGSTVRMPYSIPPLLISSLLSSDPSLNLGFYSTSKGTTYSLTYLGDVQPSGTGFIEVLASDAQIIGLWTYVVSQGPLVRK